MDYDVPICDTVVVVGMELTIFELSGTKSVSIVMEHLYRRSSYCIGILVRLCSAIFVFHC